MRFTYGYRHYPTVDFRFVLAAYTLELFYDNFFTTKVKAFMKNVIENKISIHELHQVCQHVHKNGDRMQMAYAWNTNKNLCEVLYFASMGPHTPFQVWRCTLDAEKTLPSQAVESPLLGWYEREMADLYGIKLMNHPENEPLVIQARKPINNNNDLQLLPFGPVRAGVCESAQFFYLYAGESILHFYEKLFFKYRAMEQRFEGLMPTLGGILSQRVSGVGSVAHVIAFSQAVESACECEIPKRAKQWRVILSELERLYNHLHYLGHLCHTTTLKIGESQGKILEEKVKQLNAMVTGSRFLRDIITPGGLRREPNLKPLQNNFKKLADQILIYLDQVAKTNSHIDRLIGTGVLTHEVAFDEGATGPVARASGHTTDFRFDHPYAAYDDFLISKAETTSGDALARMQVRIKEISDSIHIISKITSELSDTPVFSDYEIPPYAEGLGWSESPRGGLFYAVHFDEDGKLLRVKIKSPSFSNWRVFPFTVHQTNMMDYAINEASFGSTIAGCDR